MTKIAILGAGNGGCASAVDLTLAGFDVNLCSAYNPQHLRPILDKGGIEYSGFKGEGFVRLKATADFEEAITNADLIIIVTPSSVHEVYARLLGAAFSKSPNSNDRRIVMLNGSNTGAALFVAKILKSIAGVSQTLVCETDILTYVCRLQSATHVKIYHRVKRRLVSSFPSKYNEEVYENVKAIFPELELADNVLQTSLSNINAVLHPPGMILNAGWIEHKGGNFLFYSEGVTSGVANIIEHVDRERLAIIQKLEIKGETFSELFYRYGLSSAIYPSVYQTIKSSDIIRIIGAPDKLDHRYLLEDIGYGLVPMASIAKVIGVQTPTIDSLINIASILNNVNHWETGLTAKKVGMLDTDLAKIKSYLHDGLY